MDKRASFEVCTKKNVFSQEGINSFEQIHDEWELSICEKNPHDALVGDEKFTIAVVTLRTFALGKLDLLTVLPRELQFRSVTDFSPGKLPRENFFPSKLEYVKRTIEFPLTVTLHVLKG